MSTQTNAVGASTDSTATQVQPRQDPLTQKETFLKLLVAQIKNQDPLNPTDGTQFLGQLAQFTQLEQMMNIRTDVEAIGDTLKQALPAQPAGGTDSTQEKN
jgi:flagellar basal-body rod modification protein FlgD